MLLFRWVQTNYQGHSSKSGVYQIRNLNNGRVYIGSAKCFRVRKQQHVASLKRTTHHNKYLQHDFNKCGEEMFIFEVLEVVEGEQVDRILIEQTKLDSLYDNQDACYNFKKQAIYINGELISAGLSTLESKKKRSESAKRMWKQETHRVKIREAMKPYRDEQVINLNKYREEALKAASKTNAKHYGKLIDPEGTVFDITNMQKFCDDRKLDRRCMTQVLKGNIPSYYGWRTYKLETIGVPYVTNKNHRQKQFKLLGPDGHVYSDTNIANFAKTHNISKENLSAVIRGIRKHHKGWSLCDEAQLLTESI